jgi:hypothetical protein
MLVTHPDCYACTAFCSWGKCNETAGDCEFETGQTADGMFKIVMGASSKQLVTC